MLRRKLHTPLSGLARSVDRTRRIHSIPSLRLSSPETEGVGALFSPAGFKTAWSSYQAYAIDNLNRVSAETEYESLPLVKTIAQTARQPENARIYNYAAQAFSNHFYFDALSASPVSISSEIKALIESSFGSVEAFKDSVGDIAESVLGSGWVWIVLDASQKLKVLGTYNSGTPFDFHRIQNVDPNTAATPTRSKEDEMALYQAMKMPYSLTPIACLSLWQHSYLVDFGVDGKRAYVNRFFEAIDWNVIATRIADAKSG